MISPFSNEIMHSSSQELLDGHHEAVPTRPAIQYELYKTIHVSLYPRVIF